MYPPVTIVVSLNARDLFAVSLYADLAFKPVVYLTFGLQCASRQNIKPLFIFEYFHSYNCSFINKSSFADVDSGHLARHLTNSITHLCLVAASLCGY